MKCWKRKKLCMAEEGPPGLMITVYYWGYPDQPPKGTRPYGSYYNSGGKTN